MVKEGFYYYTIESRVVEVGQRMSVGVGMRGTIYSNIAKCQVLSV